MGKLALFFGQIKDKWALRGAYLPVGHDAVKKRPSLTFAVFWLSSLIALVSTICLHFFDTLVATGMSYILMILCFIFYRMRTIQSAKIDIDDQSIELSSQKDNKKKKKKPAPKSDPEPQD